MVGLVANESLNIMNFGEFDTWIRQAFMQG